MVFGGTLGLTILTAFLTFIVTNIDDFGLLLVYFARAKSYKNMTSFNVYLGQFIGFTIICLLSMLGMVLGFFISKKYLALLGFIPLFIGLKEIYSLLFGKTGNEEENKDYEYKMLENVEEKPLYDNDTSKNGYSSLANLPSSFLKCILNTQALEVALVTIANGGDNIAIYMPLFATSSLFNLFITLLVFYVLLLIWLVLASNIVGIKCVLEFLENNQRYLIPVVFISLGVYILSESVLLDLLL